MDYRPDEDMANPTGSVFCSHGSGCYVEWDQVPDYMHVESVLNETGIPETEESVWKEYQLQNHTKTSTEEKWIGTDEVDEI